MNDPLPPPVVLKRLRRRWPYLVLLLALALLGLVGAYFYAAGGADRQWRAAVTEAEGLAPPWRLEDVEAGRAAVADARNSAPVVLAAKRRLPRRWPAWEWAAPGEDLDAPDAQRAALDASFRDLPPFQPLGPEQVAALRAELKKAGPALEEARKLAELPEGRFPIRYGLDVTFPPHLQEVREVAHLLSFDVLLRAHDRDADGALASCRAILNAGRSLRDEPLAVSQLVRIACRAIALGRLQRALAQGLPSEAALLQLQRLLEQEEQGPVMLVVARGERAGWDRFLESALAGQVKLSEKEVGLLTLFHPEEKPEEEWLALRKRRVLVAQRAALLRHLNRAVVIAGLPGERQVEEFRRWEASAKGQPFLVRVLSPPLTKTAESCVRTQAQLRCAIAAVAAMRYGRGRGHWPDGLEALREAGYLREVPTDLYDGRPLRLRRPEGGLMVYSVGAHGQDYGGQVDYTNPTAPGTNLGFHLWDWVLRR